MKSARTFVVVAVAALGIGGAGTAVAAKTKPTPKHITIGVTEKVKYHINRGVTQTLRYNKDVYAVKSGGTVKWAPNSKQEPHTLSIIKSKKSLPKTAKAIEACGNGGGLCGPLGAAHQFNPQTGQVGVPTYDVNKPGIDTGGSKTKAGDSYYADPGSKAQTIKVSAKRGTTLYLFCAVHPWMQAKLLVK